ncbi:hypothetical protein [Miltoncostaea marina]|uniref:hypothetical protein n=1 Tax=Miltoncostaea marina TaxID=2843215 RepID=UPI001C3C5FB0|nr:hypothetical protein [Miltoncostaea marina]
MTRRALAALAALLLALPAGALARGPGEGADRREAERGRVPSAQLAAAGSGTMTITGRLAIAGHIPGGGTVTIQDKAGDAVARLAGERVRLRRGTARVRDASGLLFVAGSRLTVRVTGARLSFSIAGHGRARLRGKGVYRLNGGPERGWPRGWIALAPAGRRGR